MSLFLFIKIIFILILLLWYIQHKDKIFLYIGLTSLAFFLGDLWKLLKQYIDFTDSVDFVVDKILIVVYLVAIGIIILTGKRMYRSK